MLYWLSDDGSSIFDLKYFRNQFMHRRINVTVRWLLYGYIEVPRHWLDSLIHRVKDEMQLTTIIYTFYNAQLPIRSTTNVLTSFDICQCLLIFLLNLSRFSTALLCVCLIRINRRIQLWIMRISGVK